MNRISRLWLLVSALAIAVACSSSSDEDGGGEGAAVGQQMSELGDLGAQFIEANQATYDTLGQASGLIGAAFAGGLPAPSTALKQAGCLPDELAGQTLLVDVQSDTFTPTDPRGPSNAVQFVLLSDPQTEVGYVNLTCVGVLPSAITVNITVNTTDDTEVLNLTASNISAFPPSNFSATLAGTLSSSGGDSVQFGAFGFENSSIFLDEISRFTSTAFLVGEGITASVNQNVTLEPSFTSETIRLNVQGAPNFDPEAICPNSFLYNGSMMGTPGDVSGGAVFCAPPPLADGFNYFVNCFDGSIEDMVVSSATVACIGMAGIFEGNPSQVGGAVLQDIQDGTDALLGMHNTVIAVAEAGGEVALKLAEAAQQQF